MNRWTFLAAATAAALVSFGASAQTDWPTKPISMVVPYPPGGVNDAVASVYAEKLSQEFGKAVIVDNRAGAATTVASNFVAHAAPDGYTIYAGGTSLVINPTLTGNVQYDPHKSFELVSLMSFTPFILHVTASFPAKDMQELIAYVKANPGKFNIASSGIGAMNHMSAELFKARTGLKIAHVPYRGGAQAGQDVAAGNAQMMFSAALEAKPVLAELAAALQGLSDRRFQVAGHTDTTGSDALNWRLSVARAVSVVETLVADGVPAKNLSAGGYGPHMPVAGNETEEGKKRNRRVELLLMPDLGELLNLAK